MPAEGRTTTAINLALALAEVDHNVVVVDADLRRPPRVASYLGVDGQVGLSTVLSGGDASLQDALRQTRFDRLTVLPSGGAVPGNPTELLESQAATTVLHQLGEDFDYVIVDSPPMLVTDSAILAANAQGTLVLAKYGHTKLRQLVQTVTALRRPGPPVLGAVLTMTPAKKRSSLEDSYYGVPAAQQDSRQPGRRWRPGSHQK